MPPLTVTFSQPTKNYHPGMNKFSVMTPQEMRAFKGRSKGAHQNHVPKNLMAQPEDVVANMKPVNELPKSVDWRNSGIVTAVKNQGMCGSCWAFASTSVIESSLAKETGLLFDLSTQQTAMCSPNPEKCGGTGGCAGATAEIAFDYYANSQGIFEEWAYSYLSFYGQNMECSLPNKAKPVAGITGYVQLPANNYTALMNAVATVGPIAISVDASNWGSYKGGIFSGCNQANPDIDHAVVLVGYGEEVVGDLTQKYWLVRNSWSPAWGEQGYIRIARFDFDEQICGTDVTPQDGSACEGQTDPVKVCGVCGILFDSSYPTGAYLL